MPALFSEPWKRRLNHSPFRKQQQLTGCRSPNTTTTIIIITIMGCGVACCRTPIIIITIITTIITTGTPIDEDHVVVEGGPRAALFL